MDFNLLLKLLFLLYVIVIIIYAYVCVCLSHYYFICYTSVYFIIHSLYMHVGTCLYCVILHLVYLMQHQLHGLRTQCRGSLVDIVCSSILPVSARPHNPVLKRCRSNDHQILCVAVIIQAGFNNNNNIINIHTFIGV